MNPQLAPYVSFLEQVLTPSRLKHSLGVMQVMEDLVDIYKLDRDKAILAGLLHDAGKDLSPHQQEQLLAEAGIPIQSPWDQDYAIYMHGPVGAYFVKKELGIKDPLILDAITMHTYCGDGKNFHAPLVWCLRFADLLEPNRKWDQRAHLIRDREPRLRELVFNGQMDEAAFFQIDLLIRFFEEIGSPVHPNMRKILSRGPGPGLDASWDAL